MKLPGDASTTPLKFVSSEASWIHLSMHGIDDSSGVEVATATYTDVDKVADVK